MDNSTDPLPDLAHLKNELLNIQSEWLTTEGLLKRVELALGKQITASINELRYAGRQLVYAVNALGANKPDDAQKSLVEVWHNLIKARHDAVDTAFSHIRDQSSQISYRVKAETITHHFPRYTELYNLLRKITSDISKSRGKNLIDRTGVYNSIIKNDLTPLLELYEEFKAALPDIGDNLAAEIGLIENSDKKTPLHPFELSTRKLVKWATPSFIVFVLTLIVAVAAFIVALLDLLLN